MAVSKNYRDYVLDQLGGLGDVSAPRLFGGFGLYQDEWFFGLLYNDTLFLKVDDSNRPDYVGRGMQAFQPRKDKQSMSYFEVPADVLEDRTELATWARKSIGVAASMLPKKRRTRGGRKTAQGAMPKPASRAKTLRSTRSTEKRAPTTSAQRSKRRPKETPSASSARRSIKNPSRSRS